MKGVFIMTEVVVSDMVVSDMLKPSEQDRLADIGH